MICGPDFFYLIFFLIFFIYFFFFFLLLIFLFLFANKMFGEGHAIGQQCIGQV